MRNLVPLCILAVVLVPVGCSKGNFSQRENAGRANVFSYPIANNPTTLDPGMVQDGDTIDMLQQVYEGLVGWGEDNTPHPLVAESWDVKNGGTSYIFHIRKGVKFHNGREVHADDFKWTYERNCSHDFPSPVVADYLNDIVGFDAYHKGQAKELAGVKVIDPYTIEIDIDKPRAYFLGKLTYLDAAVLCKEAIPAGQQITKAEQMVGCGAFRCIQYVPEQTTVLEAFKDYHGGAPQVQRIERPVMKDAATRLNKFKSGEVDLVQLERQDVPALMNDSQYKSQLHFYPRPSIFYIGMNQKAQPLFKNRDFRRAIAMAINRDFIVKQVLGNLVEVANGILPPGVLGHRDKTALLPYDVAAAKKSLAAAGFSDPSTVPELTITFRTEKPDYKIVAEAAASEIQQNLGIKVSLRNIDWTAYLKIWDAGEIPFFHMRWAADYLDPQNFLSTMLATTGNESRGINYSNPQFDALCAQADLEQDPNKRLALYAQAEDLVLQDSPWVPIYFQRDAELINPRVQGLRESLFGHLPHTTVRLTQ